MMGVNCTYYGDHFTIYVSQTMMPHTLTLYGAVCESELNKTGGESPQSTCSFSNLFRSCEAVLIISSLMIFPKILQ